GTKDKSITERIARDLENRVALRKEGVVDPKEENYAVHHARNLLEHIDEWARALGARGNTAQHVKLHSSRAMRVVALVGGADLAVIEPGRRATREMIQKAEASLRRWAAKGRIAHLTAEAVQQALARLIAEGRSYSTANHHRGAIKSFAKWLFDTHRVR